jgi:hypothetical protein
MVLQRLTNLPGNSLQFTGKFLLNISAVVVKGVNAHH